MDKKYLAIFAVLVMGLFIAGCSGPVGKKIIEENNGEGSGSKLEINNGDDVVINGDLTVYGTAYLRGPTDFYENVYYSPDAPVDFDGVVNFNGLGGAGNAYACLDFGGQLYRSSTPCV